ncbi:MAG: sulfotransferase [Deltaproteobacteria bacterium]|nr:sulfotransferase [Deltaproteobacteria bacterium]
MTQLILVVGNGRSGTNLLGKLIASHPGVEGYIEEEPIFGLVTKAALYNDGDALYAAREWYESKLKACTKPYLLDKSHMNLWLVERWLRVFPNVKIIGIRRDAYNTILSAREHMGVQSHYLRLDLVGKDCRALGLKAKDWSRSLTAKLLLRWQAHEDEFRRLSWIPTIEYRNLVRDPGNALEKLGLGNLPKGIDCSIIKPPTKRPFDKALIDEIIFYASQHED